VVGFAADAKDEAGFLHARIGSGGAERFVTGDAGDGGVAFHFEGEGEPLAAGQPGGRAGDDFVFRGFVGFVGVLGNRPGVGCDDEGEEVALFLELTFGGIEAEVEGSGAVELHVELDEAVLEREGFAEGGDMLVGGELAGAEGAVVRGELAGVAGPAGGERGGVEFFVEEEFAALAERGLEVGGGGGEERGRDEGEDRRDEAGGVHGGEEGGGDAASQSLRSRRRACGM